MGAAGATVYVTGRSTRAGARTNDRPEMIEEAADPGVMAKTGRCLTAGELAREYGFTDIDGRYIMRFAIP